MYKRRLKWGGFLGLVAGGLTASAITHGNIQGLWLLLWPGGLLVGLLVGHIAAMRKFERDFHAQTGLDSWETYKAMRKRKGS